MNFYKLEPAYVTIKIVLLKKFESSLRRVSEKIASWQAFKIRPEGNIEFLQQRQQLLFIK